MERIISDKFGCQVIERDNIFFLRFDNGQSASKMIEHEITRNEAYKVISSENEAYNIIIAVMKKLKN